MTGTGVDWLQEAVEADATCTPARGNSRRSTRRASRACTSFSLATTRPRRSASVAPDRRRGLRTGDDLHRLSDRARGDGRGRFVRGASLGCGRYRLVTTVLKRVRREHGVSVRFDVVDREVSHRARRAAAVKRPKLDAATVGQRYDWDSVEGSDGRQLPCTVSLTWESFRPSSGTRRKRRRATNSSTSRVPARRDDR